MFRNIKIESRLALGFSIVLVIMFAIIGVSLRQAQVSDKNLEHIVTVNNVRVQLANNMIDDVRETAITVRDILLATHTINIESSESAQKGRDNLAELRRTYTDNIDAIKKLISKDDKEGFDLISKIETSGSAARQLQDQVIELTMAGKHIEGIDFMAGKAYPIVKQWISETKDFVHHNEGRTALRFNEAKKTAHLAHTTMNILGTAAIVLSVAIFIFIYLGVIERKKAEEQLEATAMDLKRKTELLEMANKELEAFSYSVSHDLRAPLRSIDGFCKAFMEDYSATLDEQGRNYLCRVCAACQQMAQLIEDMLMLSRINRSEMRHTQVDLSVLAKSIADELMQNEPQRRTEFVIAPSITANGDGQLLSIMLHNLLENAWKFTGKHPSARIEFGITKKEESTVCFVADDGAGFDMKYADKLFGAFQRLHTTEEFEGTGIGLAIVQRIVSRHGGKVWAQGETEKGAAFYFTLN
jgi:signal transduction histidine kinase